MFEKDSNGQSRVLKVSWLETRLGTMVAIANEDTLYLLEFIDRRGLEVEIERFQRKMNCVIIPGCTQPINSIKQELDDYFNGELMPFNTPFAMLGSPFQKLVWQELQKIPVGETRSYASIARAIEKPTAYRAVAQANGANQLALVIPCHRVINANGELGGYAGGVTRKKWLLNHEKKVISY